MKGLLSLGFEVCGRSRVTERGLPVGQTLTINSSTRRYPPKAAKWYHLAMEENNMQTIDASLSGAQEDELIRRTIAGERNAFNPLLLKYKDPLFDLAFRILKNRAVAEDVLQS